ncbi:MAG: ABC transporter substrate-binding protein [Anaerolineae bacterium]|nr:ABC transporter substrate-binding protein [Thermoflexales bacterium]MDW8408081.1 ABC transporter substrate-binding protein [Anaerolineae bacterium]
MIIRIATLICCGASLALASGLSATRPAHSAAPVRLNSASALSPQPHPILSDVNVRRAIAYCTDKGALIESVHSPLTPDERQALIAETFVMSSSWAFTTPAVIYAYNPAQGISLLEAAGWTLQPGDTYRTKGGKTLAFGITSTNSPYRQAYLSVWINQMRACGIQVLPNYIPGSVFFGGTTGLRVRDFESAAFAWVADEDPGGRSPFACDQIPSPNNGWSGQNYMGWCNLTASAAIQLAADTSRPQAERKEHYATVINEFANDVPSLPLFYRPNSTTWEHIDFNLQSYAQETDLSANAPTAANFEDYFGSSVTVTSPVGAVSQSISLRFEPLVSPTASLPNDQQSVVSFRLRALIANVPVSGFAFSAPITLTVSYSPTLIQGLNEQSLALYYYDVASNQWKDIYESCPIPQRYRNLNVVARRYTVRVCHLTEMALLGRRFGAYLPVVIR